MVIDGRKIAGKIISELKKLPRPKKFLAAFLVGENAETESFLKQKKKTAEELGVDFRLYKFPADIKQDPLRKEVLKIVSHKTCGGAIVQLPLPNHINKHYILNVIPREKDVDVLGERALGAFYTDRNPVIPPAVGVVEEIIENLKLEISHLRAAVVGRGFLIGRPVSLWLLTRAAELNVYASRTENLGEKLKNADLIVSGTGRANRFGATEVKSDALIIDFGYESREGKIHGDFTPPNEPSTIKYTPTPGGTGPILVAKLLENFYTLNTLRG
jgi:methylenetetrahydrofolate dehydrogenase (NADP+)/methenyltetrahydrofolate cyclohydrolase